ncbi:MAG TPA: ATP-binding protein [Microbacteriaceae bacterium]|nr:ATP-binding protein [Microbacteriaceae bacterium]
MTEQAKPRPGSRRRWLSALIERPSPLAKQLPTVFLLVVGILIVVIAEGIDFTSILDALIGIGGVIAATVLAIVMTVRRVWDGWVVMLVPMIDIIALGLFRSGTGGPASLFGGFVLLPVIWLASSPHRRYIVIAVALTSVAQLLPFFRNPPSNGDEWLRGVITPLVFAMVAVVVNELARMQRQRTQLAERLAAFREAALQESSEVLVRLREGEQRYRRLLTEFQSVWDATTAQAVISTDADGLVVRWNPGAVKLFGRPEEDVAGMLRVDSLFPQATLDLLAGRSADPIAGDPLPVGIRRLFASADEGDSVERDLELLGGGSAVVPMRLTVTSRRDELGEPLGYLLVITDETRATEVARLKDEFVGMVSHELRTPLSSILGYLELLEHDTDRPLDAEQRQFLAIIQRNAQRLAKLVSDLLFTAKVESGQFPLEVRAGDIVPVVMAAIESARPVADQAGVGLQAVVPASSPVFRFDAERIGQAIDNLLSNAIKFTPRGGQITVTLTVEQDSVAVSVRDTGIGVPEDEVGRMFTRFFRASSATREAVPGIGLGLSISKAVVTAHGGTMEVSSELGTGTEFTLRLPTNS